jgi:hypothetical protein
MREHLHDTPVVVIHNYLESFRDFLSRTGDQEALLDRRFNGDQALFWVGDPKLVISSAPIENAETFCEKWGYENTLTVSPSQLTPSLSMDILREPPLVEKVVEYADTKGRVALVPYASTKELYILADALQKEHGLEVLLPESPQRENLWVKDYVDSKVGFRTLATQWIQEENSYPFGFVSPDQAHVIEMADWFRIRGKGCVVKASIGGSGVGNLFLPIDAMPTRESIAESVRANEFLKDDLFVVEEYILSPNQVSPSMELFVPHPENGPPKITYFCDQLFEESGRFAGMLVGKELEDQPWYPKLAQTGLHIAGQLQQIGYVGYFDLDSVEDAEGNIYFVEINSRRTGGTYAHEFLYHVFGPDYGEEISMLCRNKFPSGKITTMEELEKVIGDLAYPIGGNKQGVIVMLTSMLYQGYFGFIILARTLDETKRLYQELVERLGGYQG